MTKPRRNMVSLTAAGLIHVTANPPLAVAEESVETGLLIRQAAERGHTDLGWLKSYHSFSFGGYYDQQNMGFRSLRVINDDKIAAGHGFPTHPHRDMEIISYVLDGSLQHKDSTGKGATITPDDIQMMSAGLGITHSEYNPSPTQPNHFLQIWIQPALRGLQPRYSDNKVTADQKTNEWKFIAGPDGSGASVGIYQDANIFASKLQNGQSLDYTLERSRHVWLQVATGEIIVNGTTLKSGDAVASSRATDLHITSAMDADVLLFDLA
ncbi:pirin family protein [Rubripirellula reticaptiva]|uniref:Quercetin 2,3-dioxygenase n=1 Tax=Rubripirellula reticaptiva TaxID=2528013 RepID=A0A5C6ECN0_9BACT|nr:pirin family protein [Rubripirellula reticaptiva]TWU46762.1 Quercetin 2,3-dioxygenase [Rubripirellula reticaptiva]